MKKLFVLLPLFLLQFPGWAQQTQVRDRPFVQFGIKGGINLANVEAKLYSGSKSRMSFHAGGLAHIHLSRHLAIQPEILYSGQGFEEDFSSSLSYEMKLGYINLPILVQYMYRGFRLETGPQIGFLASAEGEYSDGRKEELEDYLKSGDFSWVFGSSYLSPFGLGVHARYNLGISNINDKLTATGVTDNEINNRVWQFGVFYQFRR